MSTAAATLDRRDGHDRRRLPRRRHAELHQPERHHRQLQCSQRRADAERHRDGGAISGGAQLHHLQLHAANGDPTAGGTDTTRTISWVVNDGSAINGSSTPVTSEVNINLYISFSSGTINTNRTYTPQVSNGGSALELTNGNHSEAGSWFANTPYSITAFTASFDYTATGNSPADGMAFILQNSSAGVHALGERRGLSRLWGRRRDYPERGRRIQFVCLIYAGHRFCDQWWHHADHKAAAVIRRQEAWHSGAVTPFIPSFPTMVVT